MSFEHLCRAIGSNDLHGLPSKHGNAWSDWREDSVSLRMHEGIFSRKPGLQSMCDGEVLLPPWRDLLYRLHGLLQHIRYNVIIQISSHYGSRRQEAQRLGRILRPKFRSQKAFFYSLVSSNTEEMFYAAKRQQFLISQGYEFKTIIQLNSINISTKLVFDTEEEEDQLLDQIMSNRSQSIFKE